MVTTERGTQAGSDPIPLVDLQAHYRSIASEIDAAIQRVVDRADFTLGEKVGELETAFAAYCGVQHAIGVSSGTDALILALRAMDLCPGDEVLVPALTFTATAEAVVHCGARPVFVDVRPDDLQVDPDYAARAVGPRTRGIVPVHLYGMAANLDALRTLAQKRGLWLVEDAAQAHGATWHGQRVGGLGAAGCFSFYPGKNLGAYGDGGMVTTNDVDIAARLRLLRDHGRTSKYEHLVVGYGARLDTLQAAVVAAKLPHLDDWNAARGEAARRYDELIATRLPRVGSERREGAVHHLYVVRVPEDRRDAVVARLQARGIGAGIHYPIPLHKQRAFLDLGLGGVSLPHAERACREVLSLPLYPEITAEQQQRVVDELFHALEQS